MTVSLPQKFGPYEISVRIGAGGMGEVWRARDTRIDRDVAVKILPRDFLSSADRMRRFELEARAAGSLNHPNLVTIHDLGTQDGTPYIVMELLDGETLRDRIGVDAGARIPIRKATEISIQIANGLGAAHDKGIVHRDLKPENIFITRDGRVKILDFGLAKLMAPDAVSDDSRTQQRDTSPGAVLGTAGYMAPEQVRGQDVDHRGDIFAFGAILYEVLTGRRAFHRDSSVETMNAILTEDPAEVAHSQVHVPPAIDRIVRRCVEKRREERFQSARDLAFALEAVSGSGAHEEVAVTGARPRRSVAPLVALAVVAGAIAVTAAYWLGNRQSAHAPAPVFTQLTFSKGLESSPAIAPDGVTFAFVRDGDIHVQRTDGRNAINLTKTPALTEGAPAFSADGRQIAFHVLPAGGIFTMGATGESVRKITGSGFDPAWSPDGKQLAFSKREPTIDPRSRNTQDSSLMVIEAAGGTPRELYAGDAMQPRWSPGGERIAFWTLDDAGRRDIYTVGVVSGKAVPVTADVALDWSPAWSPDGRFLYFSSDRNGTLTPWRIPIDPRSGKVRGEATMIGAPATESGWLSAAADGSRLLFATTSDTHEIRLGRFDARSGKLIVDEVPALSGSMQIRGASPSPDGLQIAFTTEGREDLFVMRRDGSEVRQLTNDDHRDRGPTWTPDGEKIGFYSARSGTYQLWSIRPDGSELSQVSDVAVEALPNFPVYSPDGKRIAAVSTRSQAWVAGTGTLPVRSVQRLPPLAGPNETFFPMSWSPDGQRLAGRTWNVEETIHIYSFADKKYLRLPGEWRSAMFVDDHRLLLNLQNRYALHDLRSGVTTDVLDSHLRPATFTSSSPEFIAFRGAQVEGDVWMVSLGAK